MEDFEIHILSKSFHVNLTLLKVFNMSVCDTQTSCIAFCYIHTLLNKHLGKLQAMSLKLLASNDPIIPFAVSSVCVYMYIHVHASVFSIKCLEKVCHGRHYSVL